MTSLSHRKQTQPSFIMLLVCLMLFTYSASSVQAAPGDLDPTFGNGGKVITSLSGGGDTARAIVIQPDGKMIAVGSTDCGTDDFPAGPCDLALMRYNSDGTLDSSFGVGGKVTIAEGNASALVLQTDGKIVVAGTIPQLNSYYSDFMLARFNTNGTRDLSFGTNGQVNTDFFGKWDSVRAIACQPDGKLIAVGQAYNNDSPDFALARYNTDGTLDTGFGTAGKISFGFMYTDRLYAVALQPDSKIVAAGIGGSTSDFALLRYNADGSPDSTFGNNGLVLTPISPNAYDVNDIALQPDGKIVIVGEGGNINQNYGFTIVRYNPNGTLDQTFGQGGIVVTLLLNPGGEDKANAVVLQPNGKIVVAGAADTYRFGLVRYNPNGTLDSTFGNGGIVITQLTDGYNVPYDLALQPDGKLVAVGYADNPNNQYLSDFALARYLGDPVVASANPHDVLISEFRFSGAAGALDEFIELYNNTDSGIAVSAADNSNGWSLVAADGVVRYTIPFNTIIPARGHYLVANNSVNGYSLSNDPAGNLTTAIPDGAYTAGIPANTGIVLYRTSNPSNFTPANALDAVGFGATPAPYSEGVPLIPVGTTPSGEDSIFNRRLSLRGSSFNITTTSGEYSFVRKIPNALGIPQDTDNNAADFVLVATDAGTYGTQTAQLGSPAPENRSSPVVNNKIAVSLVDPLVSRLAAPNFVRTGSGNAGTLALRRHFTNQTGATVSRLRFRVYDITTLNTPVTNPPQADLRVTDSTDQTVSTTLGMVTVKGTQLEQPPMQALGGGLNSSMTVQLPTGGLANGNSLDVQFLLNVATNGKFRFFVSVEALP